VAGADDTIVACATPWGRGALAVLRLSGPQALDVARRLCPQGAAWQPRRVSLRVVHDAAGAAIDQAVLTWFPGPRSYTGEDVVELSCHGNPVLVEQVLAACAAAGARPARPGEFTRRAVAHGRMDLLAAEGLAELIAARSPAALAWLRAAEARLGPALVGLEQALLDAAAELEARLDHPGEDLGELDDAELGGRIAEVEAQARALAGTWAAGRVRLHGARVALVGEVNAGKSSLFNALLGEGRALVSPQPGTTRDVVEGSVLVEGLELTLLDTAGERESEDPLEQAGMALGRARSAQVDLVLLVVPLHRPPSPTEAELRARTAGLPRLVVGSHADLASPAQLAAREVALALSSATGQGVAQLRARIHTQVALAGPGGQAAMLASARQQALLLALAEHAAQARQALHGALGPAVAAEELTRGLERLGELRGAQVREEVLDRLFARFCIGK